MRIGPPNIPEQWTAPPVTDWRNWQQTGWLYTPDNELLLNANITGGASADHGDASKVAMQRLGKEKGGNTADWYRVSLENGWMQPRFWGDVATPYLSIRVPGADARELRRTKQLVDKIVDLGVPVIRNKITIMYGLLGQRNGGRWTGSYKELMTSDSWLDLGG